MSKSGEAYDEAVQAEWVKGGINNRDVRIKKLLRNQELLVSMICARSEKTADETKKNIRDYVDGSGGWAEEI